MRTRVVLLLGLSACTGSSYEPAGPLPEIQLLTATPTELRPREESTIRWRVAQADSVSLWKSDGTVLRDGLEAEGSYATGPIEDTTVYAIVAKNAAGTRGGSVLVKVLFDPPTIGAFEATPDEVTRGEAATLSWATSNTTSVQIKTVGGEVILEAGPSTGNTMVRPSAPTTYELTAIGKGGQRTAQTQITVLGVPPVIESFLATPSRIVVGSGSTLSWQTAGASQVVLRQGTQILRDSGDSRGALTVTPTISTAYQLSAINADGTVTASLAVTVAPPPDPPPGVQLWSVDPVVRGLAGPVEIRWDVTGVRTLELRRNGQVVPGFPALRNEAAPRNSSGTFTASISVTTRFELFLASSDDSRTEAELVVLGIGEAAEHGNSANAQLLPDTIEVRGRTSSVADWYAITVPNDGSVEAETSFGPERCDGDTRLFLFGPDGVTPLAFDDNDGPEDCSRIDPAIDLGAVGLAAGTYFLRVEADGVGAYALRVRVRGPTCGNGSTEGTEQCDDGGQVPGDGCDASCRFELEAPLAPPGGTVSVEVGPGLVRVIPIDVSGGQAIAALAADSGLLTCNGVDTALELYNPSFISLGARSNGGPSGAAGVCAALRVPADAFTTNLAPGRHYLVVRAESGSGPVSVGVLISNPSCGNTRTETRGGEQCDDGNTTSGDGCSATCQLEGTVVTESEGNNTQATADESGLAGLGRTTIIGTIDPAGDDDVFRIAIGPNQTLRLTARTHSTAGQPTSCNSAETDTRLYLEPAGVEATTPGSGEIAFNDDADPVGNVWCSVLTNVRLSGGPTGANFFVRVQGWQDVGLATYFLDLRLTP